MKNIFQGLITAMITPFSNGEIDYDAFRSLIQRQIDNKVDAIVIGGSAGEGHLLDHDEFISLIQTAKSYSANRIPVIAACSSASTKRAVETASLCQDLGVDGLMCTTPYYVKPSFEGLYQHFRSIHDSVDLPIMLYTVPSRTGCDLNDETILKLASLPKILAIKDAGADVERPLRLTAKLGNNKLNILAGNDNTGFAYRSQGATGCVSVASNIMPKLLKTMYNLVLNEELSDEDYRIAVEINRKLSPLYKAISSESNPVAVKYAAYYLGLCKNELRLPLTIASKDNQAKLRTAIDSIMQDV